MTTEQSVELALAFHGWILIKSSRVADLFPELPAYNNPQRELVAGGEGIKMFLNLQLHAHNHRGGQASKQAASVFSSWGMVGVAGGWWLCPQ